MYNDFLILLPEDVDSLDRRLTKKSSYNLRREKRKLIENYGELHITEYNVKELSQENRKKLFDTYFELKKKTHHREYNLSADEYIKKYFVTNIYTMSIYNNILAMVLSCEQTENVYVENLTYDIEYAKFSPGKIMYDIYLHKLVEKEKKMLFLAGGDLEYKRRYGSNEREIYDIHIYTSIWKRLLHHMKKIFNQEKM